MIDNELPLGKRTRTYRFFEMLPAILSYGLIGLMFVLAIIDPLYAAIYLLFIIISMLVRAIGIAYDTIRGHRRMIRAQKIDWNERLSHLENPSSANLVTIDNQKGYDYRVHLENIHKITQQPTWYPKPSEIYNAIIIAAYNEPYEVIEPAFRTLLDSSYDTSRMIIVFAYEERGGQGIIDTVNKIEAKYAHHFKSFMGVMHPKDLPDEIIGKGPNITYAAQHLEKWLHSQNIDLDKVITTTLDCDNKAHPTYFDYVTYEYIVHEDRKHLSFQPVCLYTGNIWDAPAPMRVIATGNSFWTIISSMREHLLRNFASHSQPMDALAEMNYWSKRSIVEDGHQFWRSFFHFRGDYGVVPIHVPIYQDAVLAETLKKTFITQFKQLRRWAYGASDIPFVARVLFSKQRDISRRMLLVYFLRLVDGHVSLAVIAMLVTFGGWIPLLVNTGAVHSIAAHNLPNVISAIHQTAMVGLFISIFLSFKILPPRPEQYKRSRNIGMLLQWVLMPVTSIAYGAMAALNAQTHLFLGRYLDKFDVTEKSNAQLVKKEKENRKKQQ